MKNDFGDSNAEVKTKFFSAAAATNNQAAVSGIAGKKLRFMGYECQAGGAVNVAYAIKDGSGGTQYEGGFSPLNTEKPYQLPVRDSGYWSTTAGNGIYVDNAAAATTLTLIIRYVEYTP